MEEQAGSMNIIALMQHWRERIGRQCGKGEQEGNVGRSEVMQWEREGEQAMYVEDGWQAL